MLSGQCSEVGTNTGPALPTGATGDPGDGNLVGWIVEQIQAVNLGCGVMTNDRVVSQWSDNGCSPQR